MLLQPLPWTEKVYLVEHANAKHLVGVSQRLSMAKLGRPRKPGTEEQRAEHKRARVRRNVRAFRQRQKEQGASSSSDEKNNPDYNDFPPSKWTIKSATLPIRIKRPLIVVSQKRNARIVPVGQPMHGDDQVFAKGGKNGSLKKKVSQLALAPSPYLLLAGGRYDPFNSACVQDVPIYVHEILDHASSYQWPVFRGSKVKNAIHAEDASIKSAVMRCSSAAKVSFYTLVYTGATHYSYLRRGYGTPGSIDMLRLYYKTKAIKALKEAIADLRGKYVTDEILLAMVSLAAHGTGESATFEHAGRSMPLQKTLDLAFYGSMEPGWLHLQPLVNLIRQRGGLPSIKLAGLANSITLFDVYIAHRTLSAPQFPLMLSTTEAMASMIHHKDWAAEQLSHKLASGFKLLEKMGLLADLLTVVYNMRDITVAYDHYIRGGLDVPDMLNISWARNCTQHDLLSLPHLAGDIFVEAKCIYEVCRIATIIFADMVLWPMPRTCGVQQNLAKALMEPLGFCGLLDSWDRYPDLLLWATVIGGAASDTKPERTWFMLQMRNARIRRRVGTWPAVKEKLSAFLWWDVVYDKPGFEFWQELCQARSFSPDKG